MPPLSIPNAAWLVPAYGSPVRLRCDKARGYPKLVFCLRFQVPIYPSDTTSVTPELGKIDGTGRAFHGYSPVPLGTDSSKCYYYLGVNTDAVPKAIAQIA